jgi:hypothetical protein
VQPGQPEPRDQQDPQAQKDLPDRREPPDPQAQQVKREPRVPQDQLEQPGQQDLLVYKAQPVPPVPRAGRAWWPLRRQSHTTP